MTKAVFCRTDQGVLGCIDPCSLQQRAEPSVIQGGCTASKELVMQAKAIEKAEVKLQTETMRGKDSAQHSFNLDTILAEDDEQYVAYVNACASTSDCDCKCDYDFGSGNDGLIESAFGQFPLTLALSA